MLYTCNACRYTFPAEAYITSPHGGTVGRCPDCGKFAIRPATETEIANYIRIKKEIEEEDRMAQLTSAPS